MKWKSEKERFEVDCYVCVHSFFLFSCSSWITSKEPAGSHDRLRVIPCRGLLNRKPASYIVKSADATLIRLTYFFCFEGSTYLVQSAVSLKLLMAKQRKLIRAFLKKFGFYRVGLETSGRSYREFDTWLIRLTYVDLERREWLSAKCKTDVPRDKLLNNLVNGIVIVIGPRSSSFKSLYHKN